MGKNYEAGIEAGYRQALLGKKKSYYSFRLSHFFSNKSVEDYTSAYDIGYSLGKRQRSQDLTNKTKILLDKELKEEMIKKKEELLNKSAAKQALEETIHTYEKESKEENDMSESKSSSSQLDEITMRHLQETHAKDGRVDALYGKDHREDIVEAVNPEVKKVADEAYTQSFESTKQQMIEKDIEPRKEQAIEDQEYDSLPMSSEQLSELLDKEPSPPLDYHTPERSQEVVYQSYDEYYEANSQEYDCFDIDYDSYEHDGFDR